jgi:hypothetical protein
VELLAWPLHSQYIEPACPSVGKKPRPSMFFNAAANDCEIETF